MYYHYHYYLKKINMNSNKCDHLYSYYNVMNINDLYNLNY